ncbi:MAG: (E)-4-hydroxy-3-methylbut-2-enyl-diphosphate synthase [Bacteroidales bacterium]|nr:(E)-4-hydroxy-3-methylbut-2-enyl-diphosphate synthase [Bacteroidales bacterium]
MKTATVRVGNVLIGGGNPIVIQTMCNTHTDDVAATVEQCVRLSRAGASLIRITVPGLQDIPHIKAIKGELRSRGIGTPLVADIHFSSETAIAAASVVEKVRINPGNFHPDHQVARSRFREFIRVCKENGTAVRIGLNHGSLGKYITELYGNTPLAMAKAAMEWTDMCREEDFHNVVVSLKSSNTVTMVQAYRELAKMEAAGGEVFPFHIGVTEAGNGDSGRIKSCVGTATLLKEGIGDTIRVSLTEDPEAELPVARFISEFLSGGKASGEGLSRSQCRILQAACTWGPALINRELDEIPDSAGLDEYLKDEIMQAARRRFYKPEYIACPGCGRTMYDLQEAFEEVKARTSHLKGVVIAVMGCIVNGPGEMADADWGYVGEGGGRVSIYRKNVPVLRHVPQAEAVDRLLELIEAGQ